MTATVGLLVALGMVVVVPLGLPLLATSGLHALRAIWPVVGLVAVAALPLQAGAGAAVLTLPYLIVATAAAGLAARRAWRTFRDISGLHRCLRELTALTAVGSLFVAAGSLTAERAGYSLLGFDAGVLALTAAHFHYAGFAVATLAGLALVRAPGRLSVLGAVAVPAGTALVALGHFAGRAVELAGALALTTGLLAVAAATIRHVLPQCRAPRRLLLVATMVTPLTMAMAVWWSVGRLTGLPHPDLALTAATHGVGNAVGVCLCGLLGWRLLRPAAV